MSMNDHGTVFGVSSVDVARLCASSVLRRTGISERAKGWEMLRESVVIALADPDILDHITTRLYPGVAQRCGTTAACVERNMRSAIRSAWAGEETEYRRCLLAHRAHAGRPTCGEFIWAAARRVKFELGLGAAEKLAYDMALFEQIKGRPAGEERPRAGRALCMSTYEAIDVIRAAYDDLSQRISYDARCEGSMGWYVDSIEMLLYHISLQSTEVIEDSYVREKIIAPLQKELSHIMSLQRALQNETRRGAQEARG